MTTQAVWHRAKLALCFASLIAPASAAVAHAASITVLASAADAAVPFRFTFSIGPTLFALSDAESRSFDGLAGGTYLIAELPPLGWELATISCTNGLVANEPDPTQIVIDVADDDDVICTFINVNIRPGSLTEAAVAPVVERLSGLPLVPSFITDEAAAIRLGKALFWDMQVGSDGQACASCHFHAGADSRVTNQLSSGFIFGGNGVFDATRSGGGGPNYTLQPKDFPFHALADPQDRDSAVLFSSDDVSSSIGVFEADFNDVVPGISEEDCTPVIPDSKGFMVGDIKTRRVEPRNTPTVINAVFNHRNFWDGRANNIFNGVDPFGRRNTAARVLEVQGDDVVPVAVEFENSSLASQAVGPPLSPFEMSCGGRSFRKIGKKLFALTPLQQQLVHPNDSVLAGLSASPGLGLSNGPGGYAAMIREAFAPRFWDSDRVITYDGSGNPVVGAAGVATTTNEYTLMEANFALFWGLAVQAYEATLISADSPFDRFIDGDEGAVTDQQKQGFNVFLGAGGCVNCHATAMFTKASTLHVITTEAEEQLIERMAMADPSLGAALYDNGFYNIGVTPTPEDLGVGGDGEFGHPLSFARQYLEILGGNEVPDPFGVDPCLFELPFNPVFDLPFFPGGFGAPVGCDVQPDGLIDFFTAEPADTLANAATTAALRVAVDGAFKVPSLRNVELTGPYFHNGGQATLDQVVAFYNRGGDFAAENLADLDPDIQPLFLSPSDRAALVAFLRSLTDYRVQAQQAPFDHPQLFVPDGHFGNETAVVEDPAKPLHAIDRMKEIPAVGAAGGPLLEPYIVITPGLELTITADKQRVSVEETVGYTITVTNIGDVGLSEVSVTTDTCAPVGPASDLWATGVLDVAERWTFSCSADLMFPTTTIATVTVIDKLGEVHSASERVFVNVIGKTLAYSPEHDAFVKSSTPRRNYGSLSTLRIKESSTKYRSYLKFTLTGIDRPAAAALLRMFVTDPSPDGGSLFLVSNDHEGTPVPWTEDSLTWDNAPAISSSPLDAAGPVQKGQWVEFDVTAAVAGNGTYSFGLRSVSSNIAKYRSREGSRSPELVLLFDAVPPSSCVTEVECDDGNPCTDDTCAAGECSYVDNSAPCDDGVACTVGDLCSDGSCRAGTPDDTICDDGDDCSVDRCVQRDGCRHQDSCSRHVMVDEASITSVCGTSAADTITIAGVTVGDQPDRILVVSVGAEEADLDCDLAHPDTLVTYGGAVMSLAGAVVSDTAGWRNCSGVFYLLDPPVGTADVTVTFPSTVGNAINSRQAGAFVIYDAEQLAPELVVTRGSESPENPVITPITPVSADALVVDVIVQGNRGRFATLRPGQALRWQQSCNSASTASSTIEVPLGGYVELRWGHSDAKRFAHVLVAFAPADGVPSTTTTTTTTLQATTTTTTTSTTTTTVPAGCGNDADCADGDACTVDSCVAGQCKHVGSCALPSIEIDAGSIASVCDDSPSNTITIPSVTVGNHSSPILIVSVGGEESDADCDLGNSNASVTYGGISLTHAASAVSDLMAWRACSGLFYLLDPPPGTAAVVATFADERGNTINIRIAGAVVIYNAAQQAPQVTAVSGLDAPIDPVASSITTASDGAWIVDTIMQGNAGIFSTAAPQELLWQQSCDSASAAASALTLDQAAGVAMSWQHSNPRRYAHVVAAFAPATP